MKQLVAIVGTRPQYIKLAPLYHKLKEFPDIKLIIIDTGQHYDNEMSKFILEDLKINKIDYNLGIKETFHGIQTGKMIIQLEPLLQTLKPDHCMVFGDTNSTIAGSIVAKKLKIPTSHIEAGIRLHDMTLAEELNRRITDSISDFMFAPSEVAIENLKNEHHIGKAVFSGDIMYDAILLFKNQSKANPEISKFISNETKYIFMTLHRAENVDEPSKLKEIFKQLGSIKYIIIFPCHPRTKKNLLANNINLPKNVILVNPITYSEAIYHIHQSVLVISDSGGLPKDAYYLGKRTVEIFHESPWPELKNMNIIILSKPEELAENVNNWINKPMVNLKMPYGDGKATEIIVKEIIESMRY